jgi:hypothetical protein
MRSLFKREQAPTPLEAAEVRMHDLLAEITGEYDEGRASFTKSLIVAASLEEDGSDFEVQLLDGRLNARLEELLAKHQSEGAN